MIAGALFYYQWHSWRNRLLTRLRRLRQPKYLFGAVVGGLYFYWYFFRNLGRSGRGVLISPEHRDLAQSIAALVLFIMVLLAWILPQGRAALNFTEAEAAFLFPAPISRRTLIHFKLLKSQTVILVSAIFMTLIGRSWGGGNVVVRTLGWWIVFATLNLHTIGASFAVARLMDRGLSNRLRRVLILGAVAAMAAGIVLWLRAALPQPPALGEKTDFSWLGLYANQVFHAGPLPYLLFPFRLVAAPYFAAGSGQFLIALGPALAVLGLHYWWVVHSDVSFEEASLDLSRKMAERMAAARSGNWQAMRKPAKAKRPPFQLRPTGPPAVALFWKNLISAGNIFTTRMWLFLVWIVVFGGIMMHSMPSHFGGPGAALAFIALLLTGMSLIWGPQMLRNDLRQDLPSTDVLKMYPTPGWQVVLGEVLAPAAILAGVQWLLLLVALCLFPNKINEHSVAMGERIGFALAAATVLPCVDLIALLIPNAAVLFFPAWFQLGKDTPRGFETMGQQLILLFGQLLILTVSLAPAAAVFTIFYFVSSRLLPPGLCLLPGSVAAAVILLVEAGLGIKLLGGVFERFDLSGEVFQQA